MLGARRGRRGEGLVCRGSSDLCAEEGFFLFFGM